MVAQSVQTGREDIDDEQHAENPSVPHISEKVAKIRSFELHTLPGLLTKEG